MESTSRAGKQGVTWRVEDILNHHKQGKLDFNVSYQRGENAWKPEKKKNFLFTALNSDWADIPKIYLKSVTNEDGTTRFEVVDGKQRLTTIIEFVTGLKSDGTKSRLRYNPKDELYQDKEYFGKKFSDFTPRQKAKLLNCSFDIVILNDYPSSYVEKMFMLLQDGVPLNPQEKRAALDNFYSRAVNRVVEDFTDLFETVKQRDAGANRKSVVTHLMAILIDESITTTKGPVDELYKTAKSDQVDEAEDLVTEFLTALDGLVALYGEDGERMARRFNQTQLITLMTLYFRRPELFSEDNVEDFKQSWDEFFALKEENKTTMAIEYNLRAQQGGNTQESRERRADILERFCTQHSS